MFLDTEALKEIRIHCLAAAVSVPAKKGGCHSLKGKEFR